MSPTARSFRSTLGLFASGVAVVATECRGNLHAMTANAFSALSLDPMLILFCPDKRSRIAQHIRDAAAFSINFLRDDQRALSTYFAGGWQGTAPPPFRFMASDPAPRLEGALATLGCTLHETLEGGDHWVIFGRVRAIHRGIEPFRPLLFFEGGYHSIDFAAAAATAAPDLLNVADEPAYIHYETDDAAGRIRLPAEMRHTSVVD